MSMGGPSNSGGGGMMSEHHQGGTFPSPLFQLSWMSLPPPRVPRASF